MSCPKLKTKFKDNKANFVAFACSCDSKGGINCAYAFAEHLIPRAMPLSPPPVRLPKTTSAQE
jgi:hypothetical protein